MSIAIVDVVLKSAMHTLLLCDCRMSDKALIVLYDVRLCIT